MLAAPQPWLLHPSVALSEAEACSAVHAAEAVNADSQCFKYTLPFVCFGNQKFTKKKITYVTLI